MYQNWLCREVTNATLESRLSIQLSSHASAWAAMFHSNHNTLGFDKKHNNLLSLVFLFFKMPKIVFKVYKAKHQITLDSLYCHKENIMRFHFKKITLIADTI